MSKLKNLKFLKVFDKAVDYFKDVRTELRRVIWPTRKQLTNNTITVLLSCLIIGAIIWCSDLVFMKLIALFM